MIICSYLFSIPLIVYLLNYRIVRNKAAEKAKHVHHQQQAAAANTGSAGTGGTTGAGGGGGGPVSVIAHAPATQLTEQRPGSYSINGILGIHQHQPTSDPNGNSIKRKRMEDHGQCIVPYYSSISRIKNIRIYFKYFFTIFTIKECATSLTV